MKENKWDKWNKVDAIFTMRNKVTLHILYGGEEFFSKYRKVKEGDNRQGKQVVLLQNEDEPRLSGVYIER